MSSTRNDDTRTLTPARRFAGRKKLPLHERNELQRRNALRSAVVIDRKLLNSVNSRPARRTRAASVQECTTETPLDYRMVSRAYQELTRGMPSICFNRLRAEMNRFGIMFLLGEEELVPTDEMHDYTKRHLLPLQDNALRAIFCMGIVPVAFKRNPDNDEIYPYVPPHGTYQITVQTVRGDYEYSFYWTNARQHGISRFEVEHDITSVGRQKRIVASGYLGGAQHAPGGSTAAERGFGRYDPTVAIISNLGYDPMIDGALTSIMASIINEYVDFNRALRSNAIAAGYNAARPPLVTEQNPAFDRVSNKADQLGYFVGSDVLQSKGADGATRTEHSFRLTAEQQEQRLVNLRLLEATEGAEVVREQYGVTPDEYRAKLPTTRDFNPDLGTDEVAIAEGRKLASGDPVPVVQPTTFDGLQHNDEHIAWAMGIPTQVFAGQSHVKAGAEIANKTLNSTVHHFQAKLAEIYTLVYDHIFLDRDIFDYLNNRERRDDREPLLSESSLFTTQLGAAGVRVTFRYTPSMDVADLKYMYGRGMITWETFVYNYLQITGLEFTNSATDTDPYPEEARRIVDVPEYKEYARLEAQKELQKAQLSQQLKIAREQQESAVQLAQMKPAPGSGSSGGGSSGGGDGAKKSSSGGGGSESSRKRKAVDSSAKDADSSRAPASRSVPQASGTRTTRPPEKKSRTGGEKNR